MKSYELTEAERETLTGEEKEIYDRAIDYCNRENARGPYKGWADGHDLLLSLGWTEESRREGHRAFVKMVKPERFKKAA